jgi:TRAP-type C4-dicarboxylate transport system permease small subunit
MNPSANSAVKAISQFLAWVAGLLILVSALIVSVDVITRSILRLTFLHSFELSSYAFAASVTFGLAYTLTSRAHIRIEVVYILFKSPIRIALDLVAIVFMAVAAVAFAWFAGQTVYYTYEIGAHSSTSLAVPLVIPQALWLVGLVWFALTALWLTVRSLFNVLMHRPVLVTRDIGVLGLQEEIEQTEVALSSSGSDELPVVSRP